MKKIILKDEASTIRYEQVSTSDVIIIKLRGKIVGTIVHAISNWYVSYMGRGIWDFRHLSDAMNHDNLVGCEFYVL